MEYESFEINIYSLLSKRFRSPNIHIGYCKRENYDSITEYYTPDVDAASAPNGINGIGNATKPLQLGLFGVIGSAANRYAITFGLGDINKKIQIQGNNNNLNSGGNVVARGG